MSEFLRNKVEFCLNRVLIDGICPDPDLQPWKIKQLPLAVIKSLLESRPGLASTQEKTVVYIKYSFIKY